MNLLNNGYYNSQAVQVLNAVEYDEYDNPVGLIESPTDPSSCNFTVSNNSRCKFVDSNCFQQQVSTCYMTITGLLITDTITVFGNSAVPTISANRLDFVVGNKYYGISIFRSGVLWAYYPMCESINTTTGFTYKDCSGNARHATVVNVVYGNEGRQSEFHYLQKGFNKSGSIFLPKHLTNNTDYLGNPLIYIQDGKSFLPSGCYLQQYPNNTNLKLADSTVGLWYGPEGDPYKVSYNTLCLQDPWSEQVFIGNKTKDYKLGPISTHLTNLTPVQKLTERVVRNVVDDPLIEDPAFSHDVTVAVGDLTYSLYNAAGYTLNGIIDWGDGTTQSVNTTASQTITKTYVVAGTYTVKFTGIMNIFGPSYYGGAVNGLKVVKINNWGNVSLRLLTIGTTSVATIPNGPITGINQSAVISFASGFAWNATKLTNLPANLFLYCSKATSFGSQGAFSGCTSLTGQIPENLFRYCPNLTTVASAFQGCTRLTGQIPEDLLRYNTKLTSVASLFLNCSGLSGSIPPNLFKYNVLSTSVSQVFQGCSNLSGSIPETLFSTNVLLTNGAGIFQNCGKLTGSIPANLFRYNTEITTFDAVLAVCTGLTGNIPSDLFRYNTKVTVLQSVFRGCTGLSGAIPADIFKYNTLVTTVESTFSGCSGLTSIPTDLLRYTGTSLINASYLFINCTGITSIPANLFDYNTNVTTFLNTFNNTRITTIPSGLFVNNTKVTTFAGTFQNCTALSLIPSNLFDTNTLVTSFASTFQGCTSLTAIPVDIFKFNTEVTTFANCFYGCTNTSLTTLPADLFRYNTKVTSFAGVLAGWSKSKSLVLDVNLFRYNVSVTNMNGVFLGSGIAQLYSGIFAYNINVTDFSNLFGGAKIYSGGIPANLFDMNTKVTTFAYAINATTGVTSLPNDLFKYNILVTDFTGVLQASVGVTTLPLDIFRYNTLVTSFRNCFLNCTGLTTIPEDLFYYNSNVNSYAACLYGTINLALPTRLFNTANLGKVTTWLNFMNVTSTSYSPTGTIQKIWDVSEGGDVTYTIQPTKTDAFNNCTALTNYAQIPVVWT